MPAPSLATPAARIEARDAATSAWHDEHENLLAQEDSPREQDTLSAAATALSDLGYLVASQLYFDEGTRVCPTLTVTACDGSTITLEWDAMIDGFDYATSGDDGCDLDEIEANAEDEPSDADAEERAEQDESPVALAEVKIDEAIDALGALIEESADIGRDAAVLLLANLIALAERKGLDWQAIEDAAWANVETEAEPETCTCDGCCEDKPEAEMNYVGEGFAFCAACRAKDANAPRA